MSLIGGCRNRKRSVRRDGHEASFLCLAKCLAIENYVAVHNVNSVVIKVDVDVSVVVVRNLCFNAKFRWVRYCYADVVKFKEVVLD